MKVDRFSPGIFFRVMSCRILVRDNMLSLGVTICSTIPKAYRSLGEISIIATSACSRSHDGFDSNTWRMWDGKVLNPSNRMSPKG